MYVTVVFVIVDTLPPMFDLNLPQQLIKGLIMNIYIVRKWGHTGIFHWIAVPHARVSIMTPGDLSSFKWLEGNLDPDRFVLVFFYQILDTHLHIYQTGD